MVFIFMGCNDKSVAAFGETQGKLVADPVGFLGGNFPRLERLAYLIKQDVVVPLLFPSGDIVILTLGK